MRATRSGVAAAVIVVVVAAVCIRLGFWQLERLQQRQSANVVTAAGLELPPVALDAEVLSAISQDPTAFTFRRVVARGYYDHAGDLLLRGRSEAGSPGVHLVTPLVLSNTGTALLVNRGWLPAPDAATTDPRPYQGTDIVEVEGVIQPLPPPESESLPLSVTVGDTTIATYRRLDGPALSASHPGAPATFYLQATSSGATALPVPVSLPSLDNGPHLGYAIQWFSFAAVAIGGFLIVARKKMSGQD